MKQICVLPGDGIGPEVIEASVKVLSAATDQLEFVFADIGQSALAKHGQYLPDETFDLMKESRSCLFGAVTSSSSPGYDSPVLRFRKELDLYACLRPVKSIIPKKGGRVLDVVIVRENTEGMYTQNEVYDDLGVTTLRRVSRAGCERIVDFAMDYARKNKRKRIACVHKSNVMRASDGLFVNIFRERMRTKGKGLKADDALVDSAALWLITEPEKFDVIVTLNLYGDILSDVAAGVAGGLGFAPSGNIGPRHSVFEPAHGSAPDIAGKGVANPTAAILSGAMMLDHLKMRKEAARIRKAVESVYASGHLTVDIGGRHGTKSFSDHVVQALGRSSSR